VKTFHVLRSLGLISLFVCMSFSAFSQKLDTDKLKNIKARSIGPAGMSGRVTAIDAVVRNPDIIYIGTASGGVWKSTSGGTVWEPIFDDQKLVNIGALAITQSNPDIIWVGTGEGNPRNSLNLGAGIYRSPDAGKTWEFRGLEKTRNIHRIIIDPRDENTIYAGVEGNPWAEHPERGVYKTTDGGSNWQKILYIDEKTGVADLVMDPANPNKLICAMWEHRRWPWFFESGGPGSGIHVSVDGGKTWKKRTDKDGLPEGELGRIGLAIAPTNPSIVYAIIEAKKNALYKSTDGGSKWEKVSDGDDIGNRPFYYFDIYVDTKNENRLYTIYSRIGVSDDGGKSFRTIANEIHSDHHAFWIHPDDPSYIIEGNDGGMAISRDRGETWRYIKNLPLGQPYHVRVDNDIPYNVYGGMQDNGSWKGPGYVWRSGGIRNEYWQEVMFGDGFDVVPDPDDSRWGYAMSQGGNVGRYDSETGLSYSIKPVAPDMDTKLRFHWNAAIAQDPFDNATIYYGSQFVHKSTDKGLTWKIISTDLTTNDPEKQKQAESGGLTLDVTGAENHTTIIALAVSPIEEDIIWAGTDDGNVQLSRDGGQAWTNYASKLSGLPANSWIPQIWPSAHNAGEAWVVANNYRMGDFTPYAYHTKDFGKTWARVADENKVYGYALCILQDPVEPRLVFLGTEHGLYISIDGGSSWVQWKHGFPSVSTMDMDIQEREADLVIATFGRAFYVLDDIRPLREIAGTGGAAIEGNFAVFEPPVAINVLGYHQPPGVHFPGDATYQGDNKQRGGMISYYLNPELIKDRKTQASTRPGRPGQGSGGHPAGMTGRPSDTGGEQEQRKGNQWDSVTVNIYDGDELIRTLKYQTQAGVNRIYWGLRSKGVRYPSPYGRRGGFGGRGGSAEPAGVDVLPGEYKVVMSCGDEKDSTMITVQYDPRIEVDFEGLKASNAMYAELNKKAELIQKASGRLNESKAICDQIMADVRSKKDPDLRKVMQQTRAVQDSITSISEFIMGKKNDSQGITDRDMNALVMHLFMASRYIQSRPSGPTATEELLVQNVDILVNKAISRVNAFYEEIWPPYRELIENTDFKLFKDYKPLQLN